MKMMRLMGINKHMTDRGMVKQMDGIDKKMIDKGYNKVRKVGTKITKKGG